MMNRTKRTLRRLGFERFEDRLLLAIDTLESLDRLRELISLLAPPEELATMQSLATIERLAPVENLAPVEKLDAVGDIAVRIRLELTDLANAPISGVTAGEDFMLNVYVRDQRPTPEGVYAAYLDLNFDSDRVERTGEVVFGDLYQNGINAGGTLPGQLDEVGAFARDARSPSPEEAFLFSAPFRAIESGLVMFRASPADVLPSSDVLLFGVNNSIAVEQIAFDTASLNVISPGGTLELGSLPGISGSASGVDRGVAVGSLIPLPNSAFTSRFSAVQEGDLLPQGITPFESRSAGREARHDVSLGPQLVPQARVPADDPRLERRVRQSESSVTSDGFIELQLPAFKERRSSFGSSPSWLDISNSGRASSMANSDFRIDSPAAIARQRVFGRRFLRISWDDLFASGDGSYASSLDGMLDIATLAYETIRAEREDEGWEPISLRDLADDESSGETQHGAPVEETLAIDTLFSLGIELQAARGWRLVIDMAGDDDETGAKSNEPTTSEQEADAGPPHPPRQVEGEPATGPA